MDFVCLSASLSLALSLSLSHTRTHTHTHTHTHTLQAVAAINGSIDEVQALLDNGADPDTPHKQVCHF